MLPSTISESRWQYPIAMIAALFLTALSIDDFMINWDPAGEVGEFIKELLIITATSIFSATVIHYLFQAKSMKTLHEIITKPSSILSSIKSQEFDKYVLHYIKKNYSLNDEASDSFWTLLKDQVFSLKEHKVDYKRRIEIVGDIDDSGYQMLRIETDFELRNPNSNEIHFACFLKGNPSEIIHNNKYEISWIFVPITGKTIFPDNAFSLEVVEVEGKPVEFEFKQDESIIEFVAKPKIKTLDGKRIRYIITVKQSSEYGFVSDHVTNISRDYCITFDYRNNNHISNVYAVEFILSSGSRRPIYYDKRVEVRGDGWVLPKSGATFSWRLKK